MIDIQVSNKSPKKISEFTSLINAAFKNRSKYSSQNPFTEMLPEQVSARVCTENVTMLTAIDREAGCRMVGGCILKINNGKAYLSKVVVSPENQGDGIAGKLLESVKKIAADNGCRAIELSVGSVWDIAIHVYKRAGFRIDAVEAHVPHTYKLIHMTYIQNITVAEKLRLYIKLVISKIKFNLLFRNDSTPRLLCKILYK